MSIHRVNRTRQRGVATLVTAVVLMLAVFGISYVVSEIVINEKQIAANDWRAKEAFHAAQAGIEYGRTLGDDTASCGSPLSPPVALGSGTFEVEVCVVSGAVGLYTIQSIGWSQDSSVKRTINAAIGRLPAEVNPPNVPIVAKGGLGLTGNVKAVNNYEPLTVWSGQEFGINGSANTYITLDGNSNQLSSIKNPGGDNVYGPDVITGDVNLASATATEILSSFFNVASVASYATGSFDISQTGNYDVETDYTEKNTYYSGSSVTFSAPANGTIPEEAFDAWEASSGREWESLEAEADIPSVNVDLSSGDRYLGTPSNPVLIAVNGTLTFNGSPTIFGVIIADKVRFTGSPVIFGGLVVLSNDADAVDGAGSPTIIMDKTTMDNAFTGDDYGPIRSSWNDW